MSSRLFYVVVMCRLFFFKADYTPLCGVCVCILFIHLSVSEELSGFHLLAIVNSVMNMSVQIFL